MWCDRIVACLAVALVAFPAGAELRKFDFGRTPDPAEIAAQDIDVGADGRGLPPGQGSVEEGRAVFAANCASCHGDKGQGGLADRLVGGFGTLKDEKPIRTVGSYWPYATTLFDFIRRAMPFNAPQSLSNQDVYAVSAYVLALNGIVPGDAVVDANSLPRIKMPNRDGFTSPDPRPDVH